jgi:hypothetical protein
MIITPSTIQKPSVLRCWPALSCKGVQCSPPEKDMLFLANTHRPGSASRMMNPMSLSNHLLPRTHFPQIRCYSTWLGAVATSPVTAAPSALLANLMPYVPTSATQTIAVMAVYTLAANLIYLARRAHLRKMTLRQLWVIRTTRDPGVSRTLFGGMLLAWQCLVLFFPVVEPLARFATQGCVFFYAYPKAQGGGYIWEPLDCQHLGANQRAKRQARLDWHRFAYNIGPAGRDGFRHPPSIERNLPHIDVPRHQIRHWPWRRRIGVGVSTQQPVNEEG